MQPSNPQVAELAGGKTYLSIIPLDIVAIIDEYCPPPIRKLSGVRRVCTIPQYEHVCITPNRIYGAIGNRIYAHYHTGELLDNVFNTDDSIHNLVANDTHVFISISNFTEIIRLTDFDNEEYMNDMPKEDNIFTGENKIVVGSNHLINIRPHGLRIYNLQYINGGCGNKSYELTYTTIKGIYERENYRVLGVINNTVYIMQPFLQITEINLITGLSTYHQILPCVKNNKFQVALNRGGMMIMDEKFHVYGTDLKEICSFVAEGIDVDKCTLHNTKWAIYGYCNGIIVEFI